MIMPINLNREAQVEWDKYLDASSIDEQISHLERFLGVCVKHKGVEKHLAMAKTKLKKLKAQKSKLTLAKKGSGEKWLVPKGEDAQIAIIGSVNSGKSSTFSLFLIFFKSRIQESFFSDCINFFKTNYFKNLCNCFP